MGAEFRGQFWLYIKTALSVSDLLCDLRLPHSCLAMALEQLFKALWSIGQTPFF
jgi:hypothetical protein